MKKRKIKLRPDHHAKPEQVIEVLGELFLKDPFSERPALYDLGEARKKARLFGGYAVAHRSAYELSDTVTVAQIVESNVNSDVLDLFGKVDASYVDNDKSIGEKLYHTPVIIEELVNDENSQELNNELLELYDYVSDYSYVVFTKC